MTSATLHTSAGALPTRQNDDVTCPSCGAEVPDGSQFCPACGSPVAITPDERRLVTVLMADIVGFTSFAESADPEHVKNVVDECFARVVDDVRAFGGDLDKIVGDEIVATFGTRQAHEDDAERAVRAALAMRDTVRTLGAEIDVDVTLRIGINTGEVLVGAMRAGGDPTVMGDVVNTASRLEAVATPGAIVVGAATHTATSHVIRFRSLGELDVRGRSERVEAWEALEAIAPPGRYPRLKGAEPLVGRREEMALLHAALDLSVARRTSQVMVLTGEAGVGKTRLLVEICMDAMKRDVRVLGGICVGYGERDPWAPLAHAIRHELDIQANAGPDSVRDDVSSSVTRILTTSEGDADTDEIQRVVDAVTRVLGHETNPDVDPVRAREEESRGLFTYLEGLAAEGPLILAVTDLQWAEPELLDLIERLVDRPARTALFVVVTSRADSDALWRPSGGANTIELHVTPLDSDATTELAAGILGRPIDSAVAGLLRERSGGNPRFVQELAALIEDCDPDDPATIEARLSALPATLHGLVAARLDSLPSEQHSLLDDFAVVGMAGPTEAALSLSGRGRGDELLNALQADGLLTLEDGSFRFESELIRDVAYQTLTKSERARRHAALIPWFDDERTVTALAEHAAEAALLARELGGIAGTPDDLEPRARAALRAAAEAAEHRESFSAAHRHWDQLIALIEPNDQIELRSALLGRARAANGISDHESAQVDAERVLEESQVDGDRASEAQARSVLGSVLQSRNDYDASDQELGRAASLFRDIGDERAVADVLRQQGHNRLFSGELEEAERRISEALAAYRRLDDIRGEAWAMQNLAWIAFIRNDAVEAEERLDESVELFTRVSDWGGLSWALGLLAYVRFTRGRLHEAEDLGLAIEAEARETGNRWAQGMMGVLLANVALWTGRCALSIERAVVAGSMFEAIDDSWGQFQAAGPQARALTKLGRWDAWDDLMRTMRPIARSLADPGMHTVPDWIAAASLVDRGDGAAALAILESIDDDWIGLGSVERTAAHALALTQIGDAEAAAQLAREPFGALEDDGPRANLGATLALAELGRGDLDAADAVIASLEGLSGGTWVDRVRLDEARALAAARKGDAGQAIAALSAARGRVGETDSILDHAIVEIARATVLETLGDAAAGDAEADATRALSGLGIDADGWRRGFRLAADLPTPIAADV